MENALSMDIFKSTFAQFSSISFAYNNSLYKFEQGYPTNNTVDLAYNNTDLSRAIEAYKFFYPTMLTEAIMQYMPSSDTPNHLGIKMIAGPQHQGLTGNSDTPYAFGVLDLEADGPMVIEIPAGKFAGVVNDHNMRWILDMGIIGPDKGHGGKYLVLPPGYTGNVPAGYYVGHSNTWKVLTFIRNIPIGGNLIQALQTLDNIKIYPLAKANQPSTYRFVDITNSTLSNNLLKWEDKLDYWKQLKKVIDNETTPVEFRPMFGMLQSLGIEKGIPFNPDARTTSILEEAAKRAIAEMRVSAYADRDPARIVWNDRNWEWLPIRQFNATTGDLGVAAFLDLQATDNFVFQAAGASLSIGKRQVGPGSIYLANFHDNAGAFLDGSNTYKLTVPWPVPANLFWSATVYDVDTRSEIVTDQNRSAVRSLFEKPRPKADGSIDIYFGPHVPKGQENNWVKTIPDKGWFVYFRIYGPQAPVFDGTWKLNNIVKIK